VKWGPGSLLALRIYFISKEKERERQREGERGRERERRKEREKERGEREEQRRVILRFVVHPENYFEWSGDLDLFELYVSIFFISKREEER
jgi:hypothetical protein